MFADRSDNDVCRLLVAVFKVDIEVLIDVIDELIVLTDVSRPPIRVIKLLPV